MIYELESFEYKDFFFNKFFMFNNRSEKGRLYIEN